MIVEIADRYLMTGENHAYLKDQHCGPNYQKKVLVPFLKELQGNLVLDLACGISSATDFMEQRGCRVIELDLSSMALRHNHGDRIRAEITRLPLAPNTIDGIHFKDALTHVEDRQALMETLGRILKPGGVLLVVSAGHANPSWFCYGYRLQKGEVERRMFISSLSDYEERVQNLLSNPDAAPDSISPPYFPCTEKRTIAVAQENGFVLRRKTSWKPPLGQNDWYYENRFVLLFEKK